MARSPGAFNSLPLARFGYRPRSDSEQHRELLRHDSSGASRYGYAEGVLSAPLSNRAGRLWPVRGGRSFDLSLRCPSDTMVASPIGSWIHDMGALLTYGCGVWNLGCLC